MKLIMKILFVNTNIGYGGASKMMVWVANALADRNFNITFLTYRDDTILQPLSDKVKHIHLPLEPITGKGKGIIGSIMSIRRLIKKEKFDIAIGFLSPSQLRLSIACIGLKTKLLFSQRGDPFSNSENSKFLNYLTKWSFQRADGFVFQTEGAKSYYPRKIQDRSIVIPNPITPLKRTCNRNGNIEHRIVNVARLDIKQKRQDILIDAFNLISKHYPEYTLNFYGDGPDLEFLREKSHNNPRINFMGKTSDVVSVLQNACCSVLSSDFEGIPNTLLESMSLGVPSISTDCSPGGAAMLINSYVNGILTPRGDTKSLANAITYIISNPEKAEQMGEKAKEVNTVYSEDKIAQQWVDYIKGM